MAKKKRRTEIKAKPPVGIYNNKSLLLKEPLRLLPNVRVSIEVDGKQNGSNGRKQISGNIRPQINATIRRLVRTYFEMEKCIDRIIWIKGAQDDDEVRLIAVNRNTFPTGSVMVFYFRESENFPLPRRLADVTPEEWAEIRAGKIPLPPGWSLKNAVELDREVILTQEEKIDVG